jgi:hypothetical protein
MKEILTQTELDEMLAKHRQTAQVNIRFLRPCVGGQPAGEKGLRAFAEHHLGLEPDTPEFDAAIARIGKEEIGERDEAPELGEVEEKKVYAVNVIRHGKDGMPYIAAHQIKALIKQACTRMGLFKSNAGSKGDVSELGTIQATGASLQDPERPWEVYLRKDGKAAATSFLEITGSVGTPKGKMSISHHSELSEEGAELEFAIIWPAKKLTSKDMALVMAAASKIGLGSCLSLEDYGRFEVVRMEMV